MLFLCRINKIRQNITKGFYVLLHTPITMKKKKMFGILPKKYKARYSNGEKVPSSGIYECSVCGDYTAFKKGEIFARCQDCINEKREEINRWYVTNEVVHFMSKNLNIEFEKIETFHIKFADKITESAGSMGFVYFHTLWFGIWIVINQGWFGNWLVFDPYPYGLLTMIVSLEAIYLSTFIMISQNRLSMQSELRAELDYQVNLNTEKEVAELVVMVKEIKDEYMLTKRAESEIIKKKVSKKKVGKRTVGDIEKEEMEEEEKLLKDAGIYMIDPPSDDDDERD